MRFFKDSKAILHIALPLLTSRLMNVIVFFSGFIMISKLGPEEFAASSLANTIFVTIILTCVGILYAVGIKISHAFGAEDYQKIREYTYSGILLSIILGVAATLILIAISFLLPHLGQKPTLIPYAEAFIHSMALPMIPAMLSIVANQLVTALLKPRVVFISSIINVPITISLYYVFIFGGLGIPALGIWGFGWALFIGDLFLVAIPFSYAFTNPYFKQFDLTNLSGINKVIWQRMLAIIKLGFPMGVQFGAEIAAFSVVTFLIGIFGIAALNAVQIANQIVVLALMVPLTISEAASILVGQALGRKNPTDVRNYGFSSTLLASLILIGVSVLFFTIPKLFISIYIDVQNPALSYIVHISTLFLYVAAISQIFDGIRNVSTGALRGLHDSKYPMYVGIFVMWAIWIPAGSLLTFSLKMGPIGFQYGFALTALAGAIILLIRFHKKSKPESINYDAHN